MIRGTFQCWGTANDLIGYPEIEGCGAGGGVQGIALAWNAQCEWAEGGTSDAGRRAALFLADLSLSRGKLDEARKILEGLEEGALKKFQGERQVASGAHALAFDNFLRRGDLREVRDELERWEWELPLDRLSGQVQLRRAALYRKEKKYGDALRELGQVQSLSTAANQIPRALLLEAEILEEKGEGEEGRKRLERIVKEYPARPERKDAEKRLAEGAR